MTPKCSLNIVYTHIEMLLLPNNGECLAQNSRIDDCWVFSLKQYIYIIFSKVQGAL